VCRLLGIVGTESIPGEWLAAFADLAVTGNTPGGGPDARGHTDGWGLAFFRNGLLRESVHGAGSAASDPDYARVARKIASASLACAPESAGVLLGHVRRASPGMPVGKAWSHPFVEVRNGQPWAFAHNGGLEGYAYDEDEGLIDSQIVFRRLLANLDAAGTGDVVAAAKATEEELLREYAAYSALNFVLTDGRRLHAFRRCTEEQAYYTLHHERVGGSVLVCSQPIGPMAEASVRDGHLVSVGPDLAVTVTRVL
jgi:predicted glutamine amidotransferase